MSVGVKYSFYAISKIFFTIEQENVQVVVGARFRNIRDCIDYCWSDVITKGKQIAIEMIGVGTEEVIGSFIVKKEKDKVSFSIYHYFGDSMQKERSALILVNAKDCVDSFVTLDAAIEKAKQDTECLQTSEGQCGHAGWKCRNCRNSNE